MRDAAIWNMPEADFDAVMGVHVKGTWNVSHHAAKYWREQSKASGKRQRPHHQHHFRRRPRRQLRPDQLRHREGGHRRPDADPRLELYKIGVTVNAIGPAGLTRITASIPGAGDAFEPDELAPDEYHPMDPAGSAPLAAWLASDDAHYVTGQVIRCLDDRIIWMQGWTERKTIHSGNKRWKAADLPGIMAMDVFETRPSGLNFRSS